MKFENLFHKILFFFLTVTSCSGWHSPAALGPEIFISLSPDSSAVELHQIPEDILDYFRSERIQQKEWESFFVVYSDPKNEELKDFQIPIKGRYSVKDTLILFIPEKAFVPGSSYFARCYSRDIISKPADLITGKNFNKQKPATGFNFVR